jgi:hypothetical protein
MLSEEEGTARPRDPDWERGPSRHVATCNPGCNQSNIQIVLQKQSGQCNSTQTIFTPLIAPNNMNQRATTSHASSSFTPETSAVQQATDDLQASCSRRTHSPGQPGKQQTKSGIINNMERGAGSTKSGKKHYQVERNCAQRLPTCQALGYKRHHLRWVRQQLLLSGAGQPAAVYACTGRHR